jgi:hypothetical protein
MDDTHMKPRDLELHETQDLIDELMHRTTFLGIIVHAKEEYRGAWKTGERTFRVHHNENLSVEEAGKLLARVSEHLDGHRA